MAQHPPARHDDSRRPHGKPPDDRKSTPPDPRYLVAARRASAQSSRDHGIQAMRLQIRRWWRLYDGSPSQSARQHARRVDVFARKYGRRQQWHTRPQAASSLAGYKYGAPSLLRVAHFPQDILSSQVSSQSFLSRSSDLATFLTLTTTNGHSTPQRRRALRPPPSHTAEASRHPKASCLGKFHSSAPHPARLDTIVDTSLSPTRRDPLHLALLKLFLRNPASPPSSSIPPTTYHDAGHP